MGKKTRPSKVKYEWLMCKISQVQKIKWSRENKHCVTFVSILAWKKFSRQKNRLFFWKRISSWFVPAHQESRLEIYSTIAGNQISEKVWIFWYTFFHSHFIRFRLPASYFILFLNESAKAVFINTTRRIFNEKEHRLNGILFEVETIKKKHSTFLCDCFVAILIQ